MIIGVRMALGALRSAIFGWSCEGALMVGTGALLGLAGAVLLRRTLQSQLFEIGALDGRVIGSVAALLLAVALLAGLVPARSASRTDRMRALADRGIRQATVAPPAS